MKFGNPLEEEKMPFWQLFYHNITATKERKPLLTPAMEQEVFGYIKSKTYQLGGDLYAVNGTADHVHLVVAIPPKVALADFIGQVKGFTSAQFNKTHPDQEPFAWQTEYGAFTFDKKRLPAFITYVEQQKEHHEKGTMIPVLERWNEDEKRISESASDYDISTNFDLPSS